ncbi:MAG TPA: N,N-dimethylformamidase beta subunit family domain-containing protein [Acidimicrobiales bacterium]|nr:N,N-dimethylformamidase beta subunit family domain-containing protein [Acidimicrobiales bacterium]
MDRRTFLRRLGALAGAVVAGGGVAGCSGPAEVTKPATTVPRRRSSPGAAGATRVHEVGGLPVAEWVVEENKRPGSPGWVIPPPPGGAGPYPAPIEGFVDQVSYRQGDEITLYVSSVAPDFRADVYRMGYYQGLGGRRVHSTRELPGIVQRVPAASGDVHLVECAWRPSAKLRVGSDWAPGQYLIKLVGSGGERRYVPFTVRDDSSSAAIVVQSSVTTWQAYNLWGGYSLYGGGSTGDLADRARVVSFDRPYERPDPNGSGDFIGNEFPFVYLAERHGLDVTYWTDVDLHARPHLLANHRCLVSLGHDEYWSWQMRFDGAAAALAKGVNLAFLGANACYRQIRFEDSALGPNRRVVCYKDYKADPIYATDPKLATGASWQEDAVSLPESELIGVMYQAYGADAPLVVADASSWVFAGTGLRDKEAVHGVPAANQNVVGSEFDGFEPRLPGPRNVTILAHSPAPSVGGQLYSDMSYYTRPGGGGVFATGTARWVQLLWDGAASLDAALSFGVSPAMRPLTQITLNVLAAFARGPASRHHPSTANWQRFYSPSVAPVRSVDVS